MKTAYVRLSFDQIDEVLMKFYPIRNNRKISKEVRQEASGIIRALEKAYMQRAKEE